MSRDRLVSIIMPFYSTPPEYMKQAIESVLGQTFTRWELVLIDDGSRASSASIAAEYARQDPNRIVTLWHEGNANRGASASRNLGIAASRGEYIAFLDADDVWLPKKLEEQVAILESHPDAGVLYGSTQYWFSWSGRPEDAARDFVPRLGVPTDEIISPPWLVAKYLRGDAAVPCTCSILLRREVVEAVNGFASEFQRVYTDQVFYAKVFLETRAIVSGQCWDRYRQHEASSCVEARESGAMDQARRQFLMWLESYLRERGVTNRELWRVLRSEQRASESLTRFDVRRFGRYLSRRVRKLTRRALQP